MTFFSKIFDFKASGYGALLFFVLTASLLVSGCRTTQHQNLKVGEEVELNRITASESNIDYPFELFSEYLIKPGDMMDVLFQIRTWVKKDNFTLQVDHQLSIKFVHSPELNQKQLIRPDGTISLPYIGIYPVVGKSVAELTDELMVAYADILRDPEMYITVPQFRSSIKELKADLHTAPRGLSRLVTVRPDGNVTFPLVGDLFVANRTVPEVNEELNRLYEDYLPGLHCNLFLEKHSGTMIYVVGHVNKPGAYKIRKPITIPEALALAGSYDVGAKLDGIIVVRRSGKKIIATKVDLNDSFGFHNRNTDPDSESTKEHNKEHNNLYFLQPDDVVYVPETFLTTAAQVARDLSDIIFFRGWSVNLGFSYELRDLPSNGSTNSTTTTTTIP